MLTRYLYTANRQLVGCVVRTDEGRLGYSAVHPKDRRKLSRKLARTIALGRAEKCFCRIEKWPEMPERWIKARGNGDPWDAVDIPRAIAPHLAALAALGPKGEA